MELGDDRRLLGVAIQIPFMSQTLYTGPMVDKLGGTDISWILGLVVTVLIYYPVAKRSVVQPDSMIYPAPTETVRVVERD